MRIGYAYYNWGRWVVDCPEPGCTDARLVYEQNPETGLPTGRKLTQDVCAKGHPFQIDMPPPDVEAQIVAALSERAEDADKGWYPRNHLRARLEGWPVGQSVKELIDESRQVETFRAAERERELERLKGVLEELGIKVAPDGHFEGRL